MSSHPIGVSDQTSLRIVDFMKVESKTQDGICVYELEGRLTALTLKEVRDIMVIEFANSGISKVVLDCSKLEMIDSAGLGFLVQRYKEAAESSVSYVVCSLNQPLQQLFEVTRLNQVMQVYPNLESALR